MKSLVLALFYFLVSAVQASRPYFIASDRFEATIFCDVCHKGEISDSSLPLPDVPVIFKCEDVKSGRRHHRRGITGSDGKFSVEIPLEFQVSHCSLRVLEPPEFCNIASGVDTKVDKSMDILYQPSVYHPDHLNRYQCSKTMEKHANSRMLTPLRLGPPDPPTP